ncbi:MAG TPA: PAS domain S-box protein [Candidatus Acidoferrales bacterium]|nr:PAS domain S-box protein [Candidatus Acidoferrales bacterium]
MFRWPESERYPSYEWVNDAVLARTKISRAELLSGDSFFRLGNNIRLADHARRNATRGDSSPFEVELTARDGSTYWVEAVAQPLESAGDGALRFVCATHVITTRKEHERYRAILAATIDNEPDGVFIVRLHNEDLLAPPVLYVNRAFERMTGYTAADLSAGMYPRLLGETSNRRLVADSARAVLRGESVVTEVELYRKDGSSFWAEVRAHPLESPTVHCALSLHDITERRQAQEAMNMLSEGVAQASDFMIVTDETPVSSGGPKILHINPSFLEATGYGERDLVGMPYTEIYSENNLPATMESIRKAIEAHQPNYREVLVRRKDGSDFWIEFVDRPFMTRHGRRLRLMVGRDITLRRRSSNQLALLFAATEKASTPIVIYELDESSGLSMSYENEAAAERKHYHLLSLWSQDNESAKSIRRRLERGESSVVTYVTTTDPAHHELVQLSARPIRNETRLEAILTQERVLTGSGKNALEGARSRLIDLAVMLPAFEREDSPAEKFETLRELLRNAFNASIELGSATNDSGVHIDESNRTAYLTYNGRLARVFWRAELDSLAITALRFCLEAASHG